MLQILKCSHLLKKGLNVKEFLFHRERLNTFRFLFTRSLAKRKKEYTHLGVIRENQDRLFRKPVETKLRFVNMCPKYATVK